MTDDIEYDTPALPRIPNTGRRKDRMNETYETMTNPEKVILSWKPTDAEVEAVRERDARVAKTPTWVAIATHADIHTMAEWADQSDTDRSMMLRAYDAVCRERDEWMKATKFHGDKGETQSARIKVLEDALREAVQSFWMEAHPGRPAFKAMVYKEQVEEWRAALEAKP